MGISVGNAKVLQHRALAKAAVLAPPDPSSTGTGHAG